MAETTRTVNDIIIHAFYLTGEYSPEEQPEGAFLTEGLY